MTDTLITSTGWLEPLLPDNLPDRLLSKADDLRTEAGRLEGMLSGPTAHRIGKLLQLTNSYYSNLIEGHYTQPADFEAAAARRGSLTLSEAAMDTGADFPEVERELDALMHRGVVSVDNHPDSGTVMYRFPELEPRD